MNLPASNLMFYFNSQVPLNPQLRKAWQEWVLANNGMKEGQMIFKKSHGLCSAHFCQDSYRPGTTTRLKDTAMPSIAPEYILPCNAVGR